MQACCFASAAGTPTAPQLLQLNNTRNSSFSLLACLVLNYQIEVTFGAQFRSSNTLHQGTRIQVANSGVNTTNGGYVAFTGNCGFFDWDRVAGPLGRDAAISVEGPGFVGIAGFVFGTSAAANTYGVRVEAGGQLMIASQGGAAGISVAGAAAAIRFDDPGAGSS